MRKQRNTATRPNGLAASTPLPEIGQLLTTPTNDGFFSFAESAARQLVATKHVTTAKNYRRAAHRLSLLVTPFLAPGTTDIAFADITAPLIKHLERHILAGRASLNTSSFYLRALRAVYHRAVSANLADDCRPFDGVFTGVKRTPKRAVSRDVIERLAKLELHEGLVFSRDLFLFAFAMRGMPFVDIAFLRKADVEGDHIAYSRRKTKQVITVKLEKFMSDVIERYADSDPRSPYLFPLLSPVANASESDKLRHYHDTLARHNRNLRTISALLGCNVHLTSYVARHTWATLARDSGMNIYTLSACMGHTSVRTTEIYLATLSNSVIDEANRQFLAGIDLGA